MKLRLGRLSRLSLPLLCLGSTAQAAWAVPKEYAIAPSADGHFFQKDDGTPFFWQGDTAWLMFHRLNYSECEQYLTDRASKGFNIVLSVGFTQIGIDSPNRNGDLPFIDEDPTKPNEPYWAYVDKIVELAWSKGVRIALVPAWGKHVHSNDNKGSVLNSTTARPFGEFIGKRYPYLPKLLVADTNPYWANKDAVKNDYAAGGPTPDYTYTDWTPVYDELAYGIVDGEREASGDQFHWPLMTIHPTNQWFSGGPRDGLLALASDQVGDRDWLTFDASQSGHADYPPNPPIPWWNARRGWETVELMYAVGDTREGKTRPCIDNEPHYEERYNNGKDFLPYWNASDVRVGSWQSAFSGAAGITYGANMVMQSYIPELYDPDGSGPATPWYEQIHLPGSSQIQYIQQAILDRGEGTYFSRVPAQEIIASDTGANDKRVTATRDSNYSWIMVYTPTGETFSLRAVDLEKCGRIKASWFDPLTGNYQSFDYRSESGSKSVVFTPPTAESHDDWVLVLEGEKRK